MGVDGAIEIALGEFPTGKIIGVLAEVRHLFLGDAMPHWNDADVLVDLAA